ncbi:MAG: restriction endonuclease subunit S, partial [Thermoguttaceae bacterium]|nr:restriction endonuclease subunit S [Thermoguttaceae bacterium]
MKRKLTELCDILYGYAFDSALFTDDNSYLPLARIRDVVRGYSQTYYTGEYPVQYVLKNDDLLVGMDGEFNIARWKGGKALLNQRVCKIVANEYADEDYLRFYLSRVLKEIEQRTPFVTVKHLSAKELNKVELNVPCIETQKRISKSLSLIEAIQAARQKQLRALDELVKARFIEMFGGNYYSQVTIGDVVDTSIRSVKKVFKPTDVIRYIDISSIDNKNNIMTGYVEHVLDEAPSRAQQHIQKNDIVVSTVRPNLRNVAINNYDYSNMVASSG